VVITDVDGGLIVPLRLLGNQSCFTPVGGPQHLDADGNPTSTTIAWSQQLVWYYGCCPRASVALKATEEGAGTGLTGVFFHWGDDDDPFELTIGGLGQQTEAPLLLTTLTSNEDEVIDLRAPLVEPRIIDVQWDRESANVTDGSQVPNLLVTVEVPNRDEAQGVQFDVKVRAQRDGTRSSSCVLSPEMAFSVETQRMTRADRFTFHLPVVVPGLQSGCQPEVLYPLVYTATYSLDYGVGNHFLNCLNADPAWPEQQRDNNRLRVQRRRVARAHIETTAFSPATVNAGEPSNLIVTVHHLRDMEGIQIPVQVAPLAGSSPCITTTLLERMVRVPSDSTTQITVTFPFITTACQGSAQATYQASIPTGRGIIVGTPGVDYASLTVGPPPQPRLEITSPGRETTLYIQHEADGFPTRPMLQNVSVKIAGVTPDPTQTTTFRWKVRAQYDTREINFRSKEVFWERQVQGGTLDRDILLSCGRMVGETSWFSDDISCVAGGNVLFEVRATVNGQELMASKEEPKLLAGNNPPKSAIQAWLNNGNAEQTEWLQKMACWESRFFISGIPSVTGQRQFVEQNAVTNRFYQYLGEPVMNTIGDGGAGIMQITIPRPTSSELWDWRANVDTGKDLFDQKLYGEWADLARTRRKTNGATHYPQDVRGDDDFRTIVQNTNQWRQSQRLQPLAEVIVPNFGWYNVEEPNMTRVMRNLLVEDAVRGYNGWAGTGQFGLAMHEFRLKTDNVDITMPDGRMRRVSILIVENERIAPDGRRVADAIWIRVPPGNRPINGTYVNDVRNQNPVCP
jgi:hypothetical protein